MGRGAREMVLDMVNKFRCRNSGRGIHKLTSFTRAHSTRERTLKRQYLEERWDSHVGHKTLSFPSFWIESLHLHCKGGEDEETKRKE